MIAGAADEGFEVLLVEDNQSDAVLVRAATSELPSVQNLTVVGDGSAAIHWLEEVAAGDRAPPNVILLDLNIPGPSGFDVLRWAKSDARLRRVPVVVWSGSDRAADVRQALDEHANWYLQKPDSYTELKRVMHLLFEDWLPLHLGPGTERRSDRANS